MDKLSYCRLSPLCEGMRLQSIVYWQFNCSNKGDIIHLFINDISIFYCSQVENGVLNFFKARFFSKKSNINGEISKKAIFVNK